MKMERVEATDRRKVGFADTDAGTAAAVEKGEGNLGDPGPGDNRGGSGRQSGDAAAGKATVFIWASGVF